jgi:ectoine hydroxylase-related dioxygenase (phytanoyl-CoA dioxygenase family)
MTLADLGFARVGRVLEDDDLARLRAEHDALTAGRAAGRHGTIVQDAWRKAPGFDALVRSRASDAAVAIAGAPLVLFQDHLVAKPPGGSAEIRWHQDYAYWPLDAPTGVTMWIALDDADADNGCLHYLAGTHRLGERAPADFTDGAAMPVSALPAIDPAGRTPIAMPVRAGEALAHDPLVWHMSPPNASARPRRAWSITWIGTGVRWDPSHAPHPFTTLSNVRRGDALSPDRFPRFGG